MGPNLSAESAAGSGVMFLGLDQKSDVGRGGLGPTRGALIQDQWFHTLCSSLSLSQLTRNIFTQLCALCQAFQYVSGSCQCCSL